MIDWGKRKEEISRALYFCDKEYLAAWQKVDIDTIITQEKIMIKQLESDKAELIKELKNINEKVCVYCYEDDCAGYVNNILNQLIQKMEESK